MSEKITLIHAEAEPRPEHPDFYSLQDGSLIGAFLGEGEHLTNLFAAYLDRHGWEGHSQECTVLPLEQAAMSLPESVLQEVVSRGACIGLASNLIAEGEEFESWIESICQRTN